MIENALNQYLAESNIFSDNEQLLSEFVEKCSINEIISSLLNDKKQLTLVARKSYFHSNGFIKITLIESGLFGQKMRLHIWPQNIEHTGNNIHNHAWDYSSIVCVGELRMDTFQETVSSNSLYNKIKVGDISNMSINDYGEVFLEKTNSTLLRKHNTYSLSNDKIHKVTTDRYTATLVLQSNHLQNFSYIYLNKGEMYNPYCVTRLTPDLLESFLYEFSAKSNS